jgi:starch phosphorylase
MTPLGIRMSRAANGVSRRHGEVARGMWHPLFPESPVENVPIGHITNGVHIPTWMAAPMRELLDRHLGDWQSDPANPRVWERIDAVPDEELWQVRCELRSRFTDFIRDRAVADRLARGEPRHYVEAAEHGFDKDALTLGFGRRLAVYKRLYLLTMDAPWLLSLIGNNERAVQLVLAGKAHPQDEESKHSAQPVFGVSHDHVAAGRVSFVDNYDLHVAAQMVAGCDVWINVPRPPLEASGTSGMKAVLNGGLNLSVLDGWWAEAYDGTNGWGISADESGDAGEQDRRDANAFYEVLEREVIPAFYERDETGIPRRWVARMKASLRTIAPRFSATRMLREYAERSYRLPEDNAPRG